ncbi:MAG: type II toxin-antitoxin system RelE/ParE family toxin [Acidobacteria bacterium]|nr:type II toxin-antitoxin system RelE/ParE family toxin [Acidobacteriota bacterium]
MLAGFRHRGLARLFEQGDRRRVSPALAPKLERVLSLLQAARSPSDMALPGLDLHPLRGELAGCWAVKVSANWRVIFRFEDGNVVDVDLVDYH